MPDEKRWMQQAVADLSAAQDSLKTLHFEWACFQAQQAGEKALKSFLYSLGRTSIITHSLVDLVRAAQAHDPAFSGLLAAAKHLDAFYIGTRYPNGLMSVDPPARYFDQDDANKCIQSAQSILTVCQRSVKP